MAATTRMMRPGTMAPNCARRPPQAMTALTVGVLAALYGMPATADEGTLQEVIVTATRRSEAAQSIPASITAITGVALEQAGIVDTIDLAHSLAGINVTDKGPFGGVNGSTLIMRGLNSDSTSGEFIQSSPIVQPVATYVDDTPLFVNLRLQDLDRVEVLRGPQGTLYGSGSLGGTIRFVQNPPDPRAFDARVDAGVSTTSHTHALNEDVTGMLNLPVSDTFALRFNAGYTGEAGFINQPNLYVTDSAGVPVPAQPGNLLSPPKTYSKNGTNSYAYRSVRAAALWKPNDDFHAQLSYYHQLSTADGYPFAAPYYGTGSLQSSDYVQASTDDRVDLVALTMEYELGFATLTSNTSWAHHDNVSQGDVTSLYDFFPFYQSFYGSNPRVLVVGHQEYDDQPWAQEIRLASKSGGAYDWVGGLFYKHEQTIIREHDFYPGYFDYFNACVPVYGVSNGDGVTPSQCGLGEAYTPGPVSYIDGIPINKDQAYIGDFSTRYTDLAAFGEFTWRFAPSWSMTGGARVFRQTVSQSQQTGLLFDGPAYIANETQSNSWRKALWKTNIAYRIDPTNLVYATWSQGFRRGAVNAIPPNEVGGYVTDPALFKVAPDTADNYELGLKGTLQNRYRYSVAVYDIQWHNIQQSAFLTPLALPGAVNLGDAYSRGIEAELYGRLTDHLSVQIDYTYDETRLTSLSPTATGLGNLTVPPPAVGSPLPGTPKNTAALAIEYGHVPIGGGELRCALTAHYQGSLIPALSSTIPIVPSYTLVGARIGYTHSNWQATLYVDNLTNQLGINSYTDPSQWGNYYQALVSRPRTAGITIGYSVK
jgi:iron complex outermembrane receptor protein